MFDLNDTIAKWRCAIASREPLTTEDATELEAHLREQIEALQDRGLSEEEAFLVSNHRIGAIDDIGQEYAKVNILATWRRRLLWLIAGIVAADAIWRIESSLRALVMNMWSTEWPQTVHLWLSVAMKILMLSGCLLLVLYRPASDHLIRMLMWRRLGIWLTIVIGVVGYLFLPGTHITWILQSPSLFTQEPAVIVVFGLLIQWVVYAILAVAIWFVLRRERCEAG